MAMKLEIGDKVELKKQHPCGNKEFVILRTGADFVIRCEKCQKQMWVSRATVEKSIKKIIYSNNSTQ